MKAGQICYTVAHKDSHCINNVFFLCVCCFIYVFILCSKFSSEEEPEKGKPVKAEEHPKGQISLLLKILNKRETIIHSKCKWTRTWIFTQSHIHTNPKGTQSDGCIRGDSGFQNADW